MDRESVRSSNICRPWSELIEDASTRQLCGTRVSGLRSGEVLVSRSFDVEMAGSEDTGLLALIKAAQDGDI